MLVVGGEQGEECGNREAYYNCKNDPPTNVKGDCRNKDCVWNPKKFDNARIYGLNSPNGDHILPAENAIASRYPHNVTDASIEMVDNKVIICGGQIGNLNGNYNGQAFSDDEKMAKAKLNTCHSYDPSLKKWKEYCTLKAKRSNHASVKFLNGSIWITGLILKNFTSAYANAPIQP